MTGTGVLLVFAFSVSVGAVGLARHASTARDALPEHPVRARVLSTLKERPGASLTRLQEEAGVSWGTINHHVYMLENAGLVHGLTEGGTHRYFPQPEKGQTADGAAAGPPAEDIALLLRGRVLELVAMVRLNPGIGQRRLTREIRMGRKTLRKYVDRLTQRGLIEEASDGRRRRYHATQTLEAVLSDPIGSRALGPRLEAVSDLPSIRRLS